MPRSAAGGTTRPRPEPGSGDEDAFARPWSAAISVASNFLRYNGWVPPVFSEAVCASILTPNERRPVMFARVVIYKVSPTTGEEIARKAEQTLLPAFRQLSGFISYEVIRTGDDTAISVSHWETEPDAHAAMDVGAAWVRDNIAENVLQSASYVGPVAFARMADPVAAT